MNYFTERYKMKQKQEKWLTIAVVLSICNMIGLIALIIELNLIGG